MARQIRRFGPYVLTLGLLIGLSALLVPTPRPAEATSFVDPWWDNTSSVVECASCGCGCPRPSVWTQENVSVLTGVLLETFHITSGKGLVQDFDVSISHRSDIEGFSQVGRRNVLSFEWTAEENIINTSDPDSQGAARRSTSARPRV